MNKKPAYLTLEDGTVYEGYSYGRQVQAVGEVVFNTGMTGYVESLTDPSYTGQILAFTYPMIGNYGVRLSDMESSKISVQGVVVSELAPHYSHVKADLSLQEWLASQAVPVIAGIDTRSLTKHLRMRGSTPGIIAPEPYRGSGLAVDFRPSSASPAGIFNGRYKKTVILVDCGAKGNILRSLLKYPLRVRLVPFDYDYTNDDYDAVLISNGPGDPADYNKTIEITAKAFKKGRPVFGICLGTQIMALAAGAKTYKLLFGHRGHNQPCMELEEGRCYITSQNHGYAIDEKSLPTGWVVSYRNLNDGSIEGIRHKNKPFFSVQFHPEASPGPTDTAWLFERFYQML